MQLTRKTVGAFTTYWLQ